GLIEPAREPEGVLDRPCRPPMRLGPRDDTLTVPEIWGEKDAITGVLAQETWDWDVPLMPCRGYPSLSFLGSAAEAIQERANGQHTVLYYFGDHDPSGVEI